MGQIKKTKFLAAKNAFVSKNNKPVKCSIMKTGTGLLAVEDFRKNLKMVRYYKHVKSLPVESFQKTLKWQRIVVASHPSTKARRSENLAVFISN